MKEKIKYVIIFIAGIIISVVISVSAATVITAGEVSYTSNSNTTVQTGLDNLYTKTNTVANNVTTLKSRVDSVDLLSNTTTNASTTAESYNYLSVSNMSKYSIIFFHVHVADVHEMLSCPYGYTREQLIFNEPYVSGYYIRGGFYCDWTNNRIGIRYLNASNYAYNHVQILSVYGFVKRR